jgi:hypothetical protein
MKLPIREYVRGCGLDAQVVGGGCGEGLHTGVITSLEMELEIK